MLETLELINALAAAIEARDADNVVAAGSTLARQLAHANPDHPNTYTVVAALTRAFADDAQRSVVVRLLDSARPVACA
jgi:hypothetical protein